MEELGLFPLGLVLLPGERVPLHVFEERYRELIGECIEGDHPFGLLLGDEEGVRAVGTRASVVAVARRHPDGRMDIVVEGGTRFVTTKPTEGRPYLTAMVEDYADEPEEAPDQDDVEECLRSWRRLAEAAEAEPPEVEAEPYGLAFAIAGLVDFGTDVRQELLELRSERARLARLTDAMDDAVDVVLLQRSIRRRAAGNGHVERRSD